MFVAGVSCWCRCRIWCWCRCRIWSWCRSVGLTGVGVGFGVVRGHRSRLALGAGVGSS